MDYSSSFDELLLKDNSFRIHDRNQQKPAMEIFKVKLGLAHEIMKNVFPIIKNPHELRNETKFKSRNGHTIWYDTKKLEKLGKNYICKNFAKIISVK